MSKGKSLVEVHARIKDCKLRKNTLEVGQIENMKIRMESKVHKRNTRQ